MKNWRTEMKRWNRHISRPEDLSGYPYHDTVEYVGLGALIKALQRRIEHNHGNGIASYELDLLERQVFFTAERYAMDGNGYGVGTEEFIGRLPIRRLGPHWVVFPSELELHEVKWAGPNTEYTLDDAVRFLDEYCGPRHKWLGIDAAECNESLDAALVDMDVMQEAYDNGLGDGDYYRDEGDDDFAWQELDHHVSEMVQWIKNMRSEILAAREAKKTASTNATLPKIKKES